MSIKLYLFFKLQIIPAERNLEEMFQIYDRLKKEIFLGSIWFLINVFFYFLRIIWFLIFFFSFNLVT